MSGFRSPRLRAGVEWSQVGDRGVGFSYLGGRRFLEVEFDQDLTGRLDDLIETLVTGLPYTPATFPGEWADHAALLAALDEQGMLAEGPEPGSGGMTGVSAYAALRHVADGIRAAVRSPFAVALADGSARREQLIGYAIECWHITHLCPRAIAPVLARDDLPPGVWDRLARFYQAERDHDRLMAGALGTVGLGPERLGRTQPLPATLALMAALGVYAGNFPLGLIAALAPMEQPEDEFLDLFRASCAAHGLPAGFVAPIVAHAEINDSEKHSAISLESLSEFPYLSGEMVREAAKSVADTIEQRARIDTEIMAWYGNGGDVRDFGEHDYPVAAGRALTAHP